MWRVLKTGVRVKGEQVIGSLRKLNEKIFAICAVPGERNAWKILNTPLI
jgi:hypothetical protein